jgi:hypothetical protein
MASPDLLATRRTPSSMPSVCYSSNAFMRSVSPKGLRYECFGWFLVALALLVAPTSLGRGLLLTLVEGPCPPDCTRVDDHDEAEVGHAEAAEPAQTAEEVTLEDPHEADHPCAWPENADCPPDCGDCTCCGPASLAVFDFPGLELGMLEAFRIAWRGLPSPSRTASTPGLYRPPKSRHVG